MLTRHLPQGDMLDLQVVARLAREGGLDDSYSIVPLKGGANNRLYRLDVGDKSRAVLKSYFYHPDDPRDRLKAEFSFSSFAWDQGIHCLPQPLACDPQSRMALYQYLPGRAPWPGEVSESMVAQALEFYHRVNQHVESPQAQALPLASEPCFSLVDHVGLVERRVERLEKVEGAQPGYRDLQRFVAGKLRPAWEAVSNRIAQQSRKVGLSMESHLSFEDRCLSPSDFGFHNVIVGPDGSLSFIDFEYAGWDDPARMVCDFFCQQAVPVPMDYYRRFAQSVTAPLSDPAMHLRRMDLLLPLYQLKWCCILLNDFLPVGSARRSFAGSQADLAERRASQLIKARSALDACQNAMKD